MVSSSQFCQQVFNSKIKLRICSGECGVRGNPRVMVAVAS